MKHKKSGNPGKLQQGFIPAKIVAETKSTITVQYDRADFDKFLKACSILKFI